jgi:hypothetical protein
MRHSIKDRIIPEISAREEIRLKQKYLREQNRLWPDYLVTVAPSDVERIAINLEMDLRPDLMLRSRHFVVQIFHRDDATRLSINRTMINSKGDWLDGITWDDLMAVKSQAGYGDMDAIEIYPRNSDIINVANIRHLWIPKVPPSFIWRKGE